MCLKRTLPLLAIAITQCSLLALAGVGVPVAAAPAATATPPAGFQLRPAPSPTATDTPQVQGPVDIEGPVPVAPRLIPTARPTPTPTPVQRPLPTIQIPAPQQTQEAETRRFTPAARATPGQRIPGDDTLSNAEQPDSSRDLTPAETVLDNLPSPTSLPSLADSEAGPLPVPDAAENRGLLANWSPWLAVFAALVALLAGLFFLRSRRQTALAGAQPIEPPAARRTTPAPPPSPAPAPAPAPRPATAPAPVMKKAGAGQVTAHPILLAITPVKLSRSMMNATLSCAIKVHNQTGHDYQNLQISGDLVTAHGKVPVSEQLAGAATDLAPLNTMPALAAGKTGEFAASLNIPIRQIRPIKQGRATLYVPLLRLRVTSDGRDPVTQTFVIGMKPPGSSKVQPFRLDEMPQTYSQIGSRALD